jgi:8-oxo-dGTP diphosphatase
VTSYFILCPKCDSEIERFKNPAPTVDIIIHAAGSILLVRRANPPHGYALPGGFIDYGESAEQAAVREALEETGLRVRLLGLLGVYSDPKRDPRSHTISSVYVGEAYDLASLQSGDDAADAGFYQLDELPPLVFDHNKVINDFIEYLEGRRQLAPIAKGDDAP